MAVNGRARVLIADDHQSLLDRIRTMLAEEFSVVASVTDGAQLVAAEAALKPDVLVVDICMPHLTGLEAAAFIRARGSQVPIVCLTSCGPDLLDAARDAGAIGYVTKATLVEDLLPAVRAALKGQGFVSAPLDPAQTGR